MSKRTWLVADTHFGHQLMAQLRPWDTIEEHDEAIIDNWNSTVAETDRVYVLGDVAMNRRHLSTIGRCKGKKVLVKGNHDIFKLKDYLPYFDDIRAYVVKPKIGVIMSHIPIHPQSLERWKLNIHGHTHEKVVQGYVLDNIIQDSYAFTQGVDPRYKCVSMEQIGYTPILLDSLI